MENNNNNIDPNMVENLGTDFNMGMNNNGYGDPNMNMGMNNNGYGDPNMNMGMNNGYGNQNMNMGMNNGYSNQNMNMGMNNGYGNQNMNMGMNNGYGNQNMNMGMNNGYGNQNMNMGYANPQMQQMNNGYNNQQGYMQPNNQMNMPMNMNGQNQMSVQQQEQMDILKDVDAYKQQLRGMRDVQALTGEVDVQNPNSIINFGQKASENISKISDEILNNMKAVKAEEANEMLVALTKIMDKFDLQEIENIKEDSPINKIFKKIGNTVAKLFQKYDSLGYEVDKIYVLLKKYESDIREANANIKKLYDGNIEQYQLLEKYIVAGEMAIEEIDSYLMQVPNMQNMNEQEKQMMQQKLEICKDMLSQRVYDLRVAENVAIQAAPMLQTMQLSNFNLMRKINSSFIVTLPIFKQCLAQAIMLKRQEIQAKSMKQLDDKTNELIQRNARNTATQSVEIAKLANTSSVQIETLEKSYQTIMKGIEDTKAINEASRIKRAEDSQRLETLKHEMKKNIGGLK